MQRSDGAHEPHGDTLAIYPPVWDAGPGALRTVVLSEAIITSLGANALVWGDRRGALCHPYYVDHHDLSDAEAQTALSWRRFALRVRDLFKTGVDTSWYELSDENAAVQVNDVVPAGPEPLGGSLFVRVRRGPEGVVVGLLDLSGSRHGSWSEPSEAGVPRVVEVSVLVERPEKWSAQAAILGLGESRFEVIDTEIGQMREGRSVVCRLAIAEGWSVLRLREVE